MHERDAFERSNIAACGRGTVIDLGALILRPEYVQLGREVTIESLALLVGDPDGELCVGDGSLVGPHAYLPGLGGCESAARWAWVRVCSC